MKVSKKLFVYIGFAAWIFIAGFLGYVIFQQMNEKTATESNIVLNQGLIGNINPAPLETEKQDVEAEIAKLEGQNTVLKERMIHDVDNVDASAVVFDIAKSSKVDVLSLTAPGSSESNLEAVLCDVVVLQAEVEGRPENIEDFITDLNLAFDTGVIQNVRITISEADNITPTANLLLELYNYRGE